MPCTIRAARQEDAASISHVIITALRETNARDYPPAIIKQVEKSFSPASVQELLA
ncbi:hypothetical protein IQ22_00634 [Pseudomonas duriflava]|uniref:GNAT family N-acetyltransferase n=1 Tax=Pseudomonas duriflava TaxID=459528 RepID=A0A562QKW4_9PSED|nr:hypothetical protein IQ22_00634 [Pseudomonas duriflava]